MKIYDYDLLLLDRSDFFFLLYNHLKCMTILEITIVFLMDPI